MPQWTVVGNDGNVRKFSNVVCAIHSKLHTPGSTVLDPQGRLISDFLCAMIWNHWDARVDQVNLGDSRYRALIRECEQIYWSSVEAGRGDMPSSQQVLKEVQ